MPLTPPHSRIPVRKHAPFLFLLNGNGRRRIALQRPPTNLSFGAKSRTASVSNEELLQALVKSDFEEEEETKSNLPAVRTYENDLGRLTLTGAVGLGQAMTAAASDGGETAAEHLSNGLLTMVIETLYPGSSPHSTVSTRLFLPSREVMEKAREIKLRISDDIFSGTTSKSILAMTFRQVVIHRGLSFEFEIFSPGFRRDMDDLSTRRELPSKIFVGSENLSVIVALAEAVCSCALDSAKRKYNKSDNGENGSMFTGWFEKPRVYTSSDSTVCVCAIPEAEIIATARKNQDDFIAMKGKLFMEKERSAQNWWAQPRYSQLSNIGGDGFSDWTNEYIPAYRLQLHAEKFGDVNLRGWEKLPDDRWEVLLSHFQMVELAGILDMFYDDPYTLPNKQLSCGLIAPVSGGTTNERKFSWKLVSALLLGGCLLVSLRIVTRLSPQDFFKARAPLTPAVSTSGTRDQVPLSPNINETDDLCVYLVRRVQFSLNRPEAVSQDKGFGAWAGELPTCLKNTSIADSSHENIENEQLLTSDLSLPEKNSEETNHGQDIASYQAVLSRDGTVLGFQPTSRTAVPHWASNPLAAALHRGKKLSPGILEPTVKISRPQEVVVIELLLSVNPDSWFILARPVQHYTN